MPDTDTQTGTDTQTAPSSVVNADGTFTENWHEPYGEDNKAYLERFKTFPDLVNSSIATKKKFGKNPDTLVEIPTEHSSDEVRAAFRKANSVPDTVEAYEYTLPDDLAVKLGPLQDGKMTAIREFAHKELELSPAKFIKLLNFYHTNIAGDIDTADIAFNEQQEQDREAGVAILKAYFGNSVEDRTLRSESVMRKYGNMILKDITGKEFNPLDELYKEIPAIKNSPWARIIFDNVAGHMSEDTIKGLEGSSGTTIMNIKTRIDENRSKMNDIMKKNPVNYRNDPTFRELDRSNTELYKQYPAKQH